MPKPHIKLKSGGGVPRVGAEAYVAGSLTHPDLRRWQPHLGSPDADLLPERNTIVARAHDLDRNHGVADGGRQTYHDNIVGCGLRLSAKPNWRVLGQTRDWAEEWGNTVEAWWRTWWDSTAPDAAELLTGDGLSSQAFNSTFSNGELLALPLWRPERGRRFATCLQMLDPARLCNKDGSPNSDRLRDGRVIDAYGKALAYQIRDSHPGDRFFTFTRYGLGGGIGTWTEIPAFAPNGRARVIHAYQQDRTAQSRGKPALTSVMRQFKVLGDYSNAELKAAAVNAMVAIFTESALDQDGIVELLQSNPDALTRYQAGLSERNASAIEFQGAKVIPLRLGEKISSFESKRPSTNFESFVTVLFRLIATGLHIPYELLMKDFSKTNYSSARAALLEAWRFFRGRRKWFATYWMSPVYRLWLEEAVMTGVIDAPGFYENWEAYCGAAWIGDGRGWVDPLKEAQATQLRLALNISTLEDECAEQGGDWQDKLTQRARELKFQKELEAEYGIAFPAAGPTAAAASNARDDDDTPPRGGDPDNEGAADRARPAGHYAAARETAAA